LQGVLADFGAYTIPVRADGTNMVVPNQSSRELLEMKKHKFRLISPVFSQQIHDQKLEIGAVESVTNFIP
jgi:hypothetical protein